MSYPDDFTPISPGPSSPTTVFLGASTPTHSAIHTQILDAIDDIHDYALTVETRLDAAENAITGVVTGIGVSIIVVSDAEPDDDDGRPDGTLYIQVS